MELVTPQLGLIFWQLVFFGILFFLLAKFAWKPILGSLQEREHQIQSALDLAEKTRADMAKMQSDNQKLLAEARAERDSILKAAKESADRIIAESKDKAKLDQGRKMIENEMERFREHEKEYKMKQYSKRALMQDHEKQGNFVDYS